jgi:hypothetical protein
VKARFSSVILCLFVAGFTLPVAPVVAAQDQPSQPGPSKYLYISNNIVHPGHFAEFYKIETDEVQALRAAHAPGIGIGAVPITGGDDVVFFHGYDSFDEMQKRHDQIVAMTQLENTLRADGAAEAPLLTDRYTSIYTYKPELSLHTNRKVEDARFIEVTVYHIASSHHHDFEALARVYVKTLDSNPNANWAYYEKMYGKDSDDTVAIFTLMKSLSDVDQEVTDNVKIPEAMGKDQMQLLMEEGSNIIKSSESDLYAINPQISYVPDSWLTDQPDFWGKK